VLAAFAVAGGSWLVLSGQVDLGLGRIRLQVSDRVEDAAAWLAEAPAAVLPTVILPPTATPSPTASPTPRPTSTRPLTNTRIPTATVTPTPTLEPTATAGIYVVRSGDTLAAIARLFGVSVDDIVAVNGIANPEALQVDQELIIPAPSTSVTEDEPTPLAINTPLAVAMASNETPAPSGPEQPTEGTVSTPEGAEVVVAAGDDEQDATSVSTLSYAVQPGDTLDAIARQFGVTVDSVMESNNIAQPENLQVDQVLVIPSPQTADHEATGGNTSEGSSATGTGAGRMETEPLPAPTLLAPVEGDRLSREDQASLKLSWQSAPLSNDLEFVVHLGYGEPNDNTVWLIENPQDVPLQSTSLMIPHSALSVVDGDAVVSYRWYVQIERVTRDGDGIVQSRDLLSPPSETVSFTWE